MRIARARDRDGRIHRGIIEGDDLVIVADFQAREPTGERIPLLGLTMESPVSPTKIVAVGRNYHAHAQELGNELPESPLLFLKPPSSILGPDEPIVLPEDSSRVDYEGELAIVIGERCKSVAADEWRSVVLGFTIANDVTARDLQKKDVQFTRGKGFDTFCPVGPWIETDLDPADLGLRTLLNDEVVQSGRTSQLIFACDVLVAFISRIMTLEPGDLILTGTPAGVGPMSAGDRVDVEIEGIGVLKSTVSG